MMDFLQKKKGFTIVELVFVILVMGILMAVVVSRFGFLSDKANETGMKTDFRAFQTASESAIAEYSFKTMNTANVEERLNSYLDQSLIFKDGYSVKENPWGFQYMLNIVKSSSDGSSGQLIFMSPKSTDENGNQTGFKLVVTVAEGAISTEIVDMQTGDSVLNPEDGSVVGIYVYRNPTKMSYYEGESFDKLGMIVKTRHADGSTNETTDYTISGGTNMSIGANVITLTYTPNSALTATVTVNAVKKQDGGQVDPSKTLSNIQVTSPPNKTSYKAGEYFNSAGMVVTATYSDGSTDNVTSSCQWNTSALTTGQSVVTVSYVQGGITKSATVSISVTEGGIVDPTNKTLQSIFVSRQPSKISYTAGESLLTAGMELTLTFSDGTTQVVTSGFTHDGYNLQAGTSSVTISYTHNGVTKNTTIPVSVNKILTGFSISKQPNKLEYTAGEAFQSSGMVATAFYSDGTSAVVTGYSLPSNLITVKGVNTFTISYTEGSVTKTADVTVYAAESGSEPEKKILNIAVDSGSNPKTQYYVGDNFDPTGLYIRVNYNDGTSKRVSSFNVDNGFNLQLGTYQLTIRYTDEYGTSNTSITVTVKERPASTLTRLAVTANPVKTTYYVGENFDPTGMILTAYYDDPSLSGVIIPLSQVTYVGNTNLSKSSQVVLIKYTTPQGTEISASVQIKMYGSLTGVALEKASERSDYAIGESYDLTGVKLKATFDDGTSTSVSPTSVAPSVFTTAGDVDVLLSYEHNNIIKTAIAKVKVRGELSSIVITKQPDKKEYREGFNFDTTGMEVVAHFGTAPNETTEVVTDYQVVDGDDLILGTNRVVIKYSYGGKTVSTSQPIVVYPKLSKPIAAGNDTTFFIDEKEEVYACGLNDVGQLGVGGKDNSGLFRKVNLTGVRQIIPGRYSKQTFFLRSDGTVMATGTNTDGRLGIGSTTSVEVPTQVKFDEGIFIKKVCAGNNYTLFLTNDNRVFVCGASVPGAGGAAVVGVKTSPEEIIAFSVMSEKVVDIEAVDDDSFYIMSNGDVYACGVNDLGTLGLGDKVSVSYPIKVEGLPPVKEIVASDTHTLFITKDNQVYATGQNENGELGLGHTKETLSPSKSILLTLAYNYSDEEKSELFANSKNTMVLKPDKTVYGIGASDGNGAGYNSSFGSAGLVKVDSDGFNQLTFGTHHCLIMKDDCKLYTHSTRNGYGELGRGKNTLSAVMSTIQMAYDFDEIDHYILLNGASYISTKSGNAYTCGFDIYQKARLGRAAGAVAEISEVSNSSDRQKILDAVRGLIPDGTRNGQDYVCYKNGGTDVIGRNLYHKAGGLYANSYDYIYPWLFKAGSAMDIVRVVSQNYGSFAYSSDGTVYACGTTNCVGDTTSVNHATTGHSSTVGAPTYSTDDFVAVGGNLLSYDAYSASDSYNYNVAIGVSKDGSLSYWGNPVAYSVPNGYVSNNVFAKNKPMTGLTNVKQVIVQQNASLALMQDGTVRHVGQVYMPNSRSITGNVSSWTTLAGVSGIEELIKAGNVGGSSYVDAVCGIKDGKLVNVCGSSAPEALKSLENIKKVKYFDCNRWFITLENGDVYAYGANTDGCLGIGIESNPTVAMKVLIDEPIAEIYTDPNYYLTTFVGESGTVYLAGNAANGRIPGFDTNQWTPVVKPVLKLAS